MKCDKCDKKIKGHVFKRFNKTLCANCYSFEFQKELNSGKYMTFKNKYNKEN